jgi:hypothetical protein
MKALILHGVNELVHDDVPMPHAGAGEVVVHLRAAAEESSRTGVGSQVRCCASGASCGEG